MPKETIGSKGNQIIVKWGRDQFNTPQIGVSMGSKFKFVQDKEQEEFDSLYFTVYDEDELDKLIWTLKRAFAQSFGNNR